MPRYLNDRCHGSCCSSPGPRGRSTLACGPRSATASCGKRTCQTLHSAGTPSTRNVQRNAPAASGTTLATTLSPLEPAIGRSLPANLGALARIGHEHLAAAPAVVSAQTQRLLGRHLPERQIEKRQDFGGQQLAARRDIVQAGQADAALASAEGSAPGCRRSTRSNRPAAGREAACTASANRPWVSSCSAPAVRHQPACRWGGGSDRGHGRPFRVARERLWL